MPACWFRYRLLISLVLPVLVVGTSQRAPGAIINVTYLGQRTGGGQGCSLQEAIYAANFRTNLSIAFTDAAGVDHFVTTQCTPGDGTDIIVLPTLGPFPFSLAIPDGHNYVGPTATPMIFNSNVTIEANGARLQWVGSGRVRAFAIGPNSVMLPGGATVSGTGSLTLRNAYLSGFSAKGGDGGACFGGGGMGAGGAIYVTAGVLTVESSTFVANSAIGGNGGGVCLDGRVGGGGGFSGNGGIGVAFASCGFDTICTAGGGGGGAFGNGGRGGTFFNGGGGGGTLYNGAPANSSAPPPGGMLCGGNGGFNDGIAVFIDATAAFCAGGGGGAPGGMGAYGGGGAGGIGIGDGVGELYREVDSGGFGGFGGGGGGGAGLGGFGGGGGGGRGGCPNNAGLFGGIGDPGGGGGAGLGGAIFNEGGSVTVRNSTFFNNTVRGGNGESGCAAVGIPGPGTISNGQGAGGAIFSLNGSLDINDSTFNSNSGTTTGGGIEVFAQSGFAATLHLNNTIIFNNGTNECYVDMQSGGIVTTAGVGNLIGFGPICNVPTISTADPQLGPLQDNGGYTPTMAITTNSPAYGTANISTSLAMDQRGFPRPSDDGHGFDIGAFELCTPAHPGVSPFPCTMLTLLNPAALTMQVSPLNGGATSPTAGSVTNYPQGSIAPIQAMPGVGYAFTGWTGGVPGNITDSTNPSTTIIMSQDQTVTANFALSPCGNTLTGRGTASSTYSPARVGLVWGTIARLDHWDILRGTALAGPYSKIASVPASSTSYLDNSGLQDGNTYAYTLNAIDGNGNLMCWSNQKAVFVP